MEREREVNRIDRGDVGVPPPEGIKSGPRVSTGAVRCPYCRADVQVATSNWVACKGCLARHHTACWSESKRCCSCGCDEYLGQPGVRGPLGPSWLSVRGVFVGFLAFALLVWASYLGNRLGRGPEPRTSDALFTSTSSTPTEIHVPPPDPRAHTRAYFGTRESHEAYFRNADGTVGMKSWNFHHFDEYCDGLRSLVLDGHALITPTPEDAAKYLRKVLELYREDRLDGEVFLTEQALRKLDSDMAAASADAARAARARAAPAPAPPARAKPARATPEATGTRAWLSFRDLKTEELIRFQVCRDGEEEVADTLEFWVNVCDVIVVEPGSTKALEILARARDLAEREGRDEDADRFSHASETIRAHLSKRR